VSVATGATGAAGATGAMPRWGVGMYEGELGREPWEISDAEMQRDMGSATRTLADLGIGAGDRVLFCSMLSEAGQFWPFVVGAMLSGAQLSCADATEGEAVRVAMFTRLVPYRAVLGVTGAILDGLDARDHSYVDAFGGIDIVGARPSAYGRLVDVGLTPYHFVLCGPAVAIGRAPDAPARVDDAEWQLDVDADESRVLVTNLRPRATQFVGTPTAVHGRNVSVGIVPDLPGRQS
jgi:hypothetical protein